MIMGIGNGVAIRFTSWDWATRFPCQRFTAWGRGIFWNIYLKNCHRKILRRLMKWRTRSRWRWWKAQRGEIFLINTLLGEERVIVTPQPGTTRDAIDVFVDHGGKKFLLVDTAGLRRPSKVKEDVEYYSVLRSIKAIRRADVVLVMLDASEGFAEQDQRIAGMAHEAGKGIIFLLNKWDLVKTAEKGMARRYIDTVHREFAFAHYAPIQFTSVLTGRGIGKLFEMIVKVDDESRKRISTAILNDFLQDVLLVNPPPTRKGRKARILYMTQPETKPPTFIIFVNEARLLHYSYLRYIENRLREAFGFEGVPLRLMVKAKKAIDGGR